MTTAASKPIPPAGPKPTTWEFTEEFDVGIAPPEAPVRAPRSTELPFASKFFAPAMMVALEGKKPHKFIPRSFFLARAAKPEGVDAKYMKEKIRGAFNKWIKAQPEAVRNSLQVLQIERTGKEPEFPEAGISVWIVTAKAKSPPAA
jgi:hypothetical protein